VIVITPSVIDHPEDKRSDGVDGGLRSSRFNIETDVRDVVYGSIAVEMSVVSGGALSLFPHRYTHVVVGEADHLKTASESLLQHNPIQRSIRPSFLSRAL